MLAARECPQAILDLDLRARRARTFLPWELAMALLTMAHHARCLTLALRTTALLTTARTFLPWELAMLSS